MIAVDSSAVVAAALDENDAERYLPLLLSAPCLIGWPTLLEIELVLMRRGNTEASELAREWRDRPLVTAIPFDGPLYEMATAAYGRFGRARHAAGLNFGDCMAYAVAKHLDLPLLYKGNDFALTDIRPALP